MKKYPVLPLLFCFMLLGSQCKNDDDQTPIATVHLLPPATQEGKNTFGCLVNGEVWVPRTTQDMVAIYQQGVLQIGVDLDSPDEGLGITVRESVISISEKYNLTNPPNSGAEFFHYKAEIVCDYASENTINGHLILTRFDQINYVISGKFEFTTVNNDCDTIKVTDGRFDMKYIP